MSQGGIFGNAKLEQLAQAVAAQCREEMFTRRVPYGPLTRDDAARVEQLQVLVIDDARWAMRELHAWDIRESIYAALDGCSIAKRRGDAARIMAARNGVLSTDLDGWVSVLNKIEDLERLYAGKRV